MTLPDGTYHLVSSDARDRYERNMARLAALDRLLAALKAYQDDLRDLTDDHCEGESTIAPWRQSSVGTIYAVKVCACGAEARYIELKVDGWLPVLEALKAVEATDADGDGQSRLA